MKHLWWLALLLVVFWLINSGHFDALLLSLGAASVALVVYLNHRMDRVNNEFQPPILLSPRLPIYLLWLAKAIIQSNIEVVRCIWQPSPAISPSVFTVKASQRSEACRVLYANSIIMTPGTVTLEVDGDELTVHALTRHSAEELRSGEMDRRIRLLES